LVGCSRRSRRGRGIAHSALLGNTYRWSARIVSAPYRRRRTSKNSGSAALWLCRNCHKLVDSDPTQFPADLLFEWRRSHERSVISSLGKAGALARFKILESHLVGFASASYLAQQIVIDKPKHWEYKLTAELLRSMLEPIRSKVEALQRGLYALPAHPIQKENLITWLSTEMDALKAQVSALANLFNGELQRAWGPLGEPGSETEILRICSLIVDACQRILDWEERVRFVIVPDELQDIQDLLVGIGTFNLRIVFDVPNWLAKLFASDPTPGTHSLTVVFDMPEGWGEKCAQAFATARRHYGL